MGNFEKGQGDGVSLGAHVEEMGREVSDKGVIYTGRQAWLAYQVLEGAHLDPNVSVGSVHDRLEGRREDGENTDTDNPDPRVLV